ncbi:hypothetical protein QDZ26_003039 [Pluralibacter gergoviae]|nr:hypothetical protein [Pluralibacter gergoviae]
MIRQMLDAGFFKVHRILPGKAALIFRNEVVVIPVSISHPLQNALAIASGQLDGPEHHPKLYGWRTQCAGSPEVNFKAAMSLQGQTFYTLTPEFIADPHMKGKDKK